MAGDIPVASIDRIYHGRTTVASDNVGSLEKIVHYLHQMGHSRIAFVHGEDDDVTRQRLAGFYRGCRDCGIEAPDEYVIPARYHEPKDSGQAVQRLMALKTPPSCILFPDDTCYLGGQTALEKMGLSIPEDVSCFGYDGMCLADVLRPRLSTYRQNAQGIGKRAAAELISVIELPKFYAPQIVMVAGSIQEGDPSQTTLEPWERFCFGIAGAGEKDGVERYIKGHKQRDGGVTIVSAITFTIGNYNLSVRTRCAESAPYLCPPHKRQDNF